ncbi:MAG TPA: FAD-dependent oxidoreductase [Paraburkholderia sp.]|jgi:3-(3-hydroxy-phenyl)propionate hydroxylase|nr:FAD-dependent oxidoreductase [Paraburkholderia sp.]
MWDVAIVGAGPVGLFAAWSLAGRGARVAVFEAYDEVPTENRAATIHSSTLSILDDTGLIDEVLARGLRADVFQWRDFVSAEIVAEYDFGLLADECPYPFAVQLEQHKLVNLIRRRLAGNPFVTYHGNCTVQRFTELDDRVIVDARDATGNVQCEARYLIGCDGARSLVRKSIGVEFEGYTFDEKFSVVTVQHDFAESMGFRVRNYLSDVDCWFGIFKVPGHDDEGVWRTTYPLKQELSTDRATAEAEVAAVYRRYLPAAVGAPITQVNTYNVHQRVAARFRRGRAMLAGDSAHVNNPLGGLGLNSGIHDAANLADKLSRVLAGEPDTLLDLYDRQRRGPAVQYVQAQSVHNKKVLEERAPEVRAANLQAMRNTVADKTAHLNYLRRASLWQMLNDSLGIQ